MPFYSGESIEAKKDMQAVNFIHLA
jgi:hypothetical protein